MVEAPLLVAVDSGVAVLTLNRPRVRNALNQELLALLARHLEALARDPEVGAAVLTGGSAVFAAGADIKEMAAAGVEAQVPAEWSAPFEAVARFPKPVVAAVNGLALGGGCELALMCDLVIAGDGARFGQPEVGLGIIPGAGGTQRWARTAGKYQAMERVLLGAPVDAWRARRLGIVNRVVPDEATLQVAIEVARALAEGPRLALRLAKESVNRAFEVGLAEGLDWERRNFSLLFATRDQKEGMQAFLERRRPRFEGR